MAVIAETNLGSRDTLAHIERQLSQINDKLAYVVERQQFQEELIGAMQPLLRLGMDGAVEKLEELEKAGYFAFGRELLGVVDRIVRAYSAADVRHLGDQVVGILDTVRNITQPDMLKMVNDVAEAVHESDEADPKGMWGLARAGKDKDVRKGIGIMIAVLKQMGRAADKIARAHPETPPVRLSVYGDAPGREAPKWVRHLAPTRRPARSEAPPSAPPSAAPPSAQRPSVVAAELPEGYGPDGFLVDPQAWTRDLAMAAAAALGVGELGDAHWKVIDWARQDFLDNGAAPNIRRLSKGADVSVRDLYQLFPGKPAIRIATIAGTKKPVGCI